MLGFSPKFIIYSGMDIFHVGCEDVKKYNNGSLKWHRPG
jgi:hypothetical protein